MVKKFFNKSGKFFIIFIKLVFLAIFAKPQLLQAFSDMLDSYALFT